MCFVVSAAGLTLLKVDEQTYEYEGVKLIASTPSL